MVKMKHLFLSLAVFASVCINAQAQTTDTRTQIFDSQIRSLRAYIEGNYYANPVIELGGKDAVHIEFDDVSYARRYLRYSLTHCDASWNPSQITESEYIGGFNLFDITDFAYSSATFEQYVHYDITISNDEVPLLLSGNYLLKVFPEDDEETVLFQQRFRVVESRMGLDVIVSSRTDIDYNDSHQQLEITIDVSNYTIQNPYNDLKVVAVQNERSDNSIMVNNPLRVSGNTIVFAHNKKLIFDAGNEYRRFEMTTTNYIGMGVESYEYVHPYRHAKLRTDFVRADGSYSYDRTQYGRYTIRESDAEDSDTQADYMITNFSLQMPKLANGTIYLDGEFTQHLQSQKYAMHYNDTTGAYELQLPLKQGAYNYQYLWVPTGAKSGRTSRIEGDFYQTVNEYQVFVYYRHPNERYDRLIGYTIAHSGQ